MVERTSHRGRLFPDTSAIARALTSALVAAALLAGCGGDEPRAAPAGADGTALRCDGDGSPTVVLESGLGVDPGTTWAAVRERLSGLTTVCVHERAGTGASPATGSRTAGTMAKELDPLLPRKPVVLVGASFGG